MQQEDNKRIESAIIGLQNCLVPTDKSALIAALKKYSQTKCNGG